MDEQGREPVEELALEPVAAGRRNHPRALWGVLGLVALAAGALVVTSSDGEGGQRPGLPVDLASRTAATAGESADSSMPAWVTYVPGEGLPSLGGEGAAYRLAGEVDEGRVRALAGAVGLEGEVQRTDGGGWSVTGEGGLGRLEVGRGYWSYFGGHQDCAAEDGSVGGCYAECTVDSDGVERCPGSGEECVRKGDVTECTFDSTGTAIAGCPPGADCEPTTTTSAGGAVPPAASCDATPGEVPDDECDDVVTDTGSDCVDDDCVAPDGAPSEPAPEVEAREAVTPPDDVASVAFDVIAASGLDVDDAVVTGVPSGSGEDGPGQWYVTVEPRLDGVPSGLLSFVEVSPDRRVLSGNGVLGELEELGDYPLLDTRATIDRANAQMGSAPMPGVAARDAAVSAEAGSQGEGGGSTGASGTAGCTDEDCATDPGEPTDTTINPCKVQPDGREICEVEGTPPPNPVPVPDPEPIEIVLVGAEHSLVLLPSTDGSTDAYLVPAYRFTAEDGGQVDLPAVADEALAGSPSTETTVPDTVLPPPEPSTPEPQPCEVLEEGDASGTTHTVQTCPTPNEDPPAGAHQVEAFVMDDHCTWLVVRIADRIWWTPSYYKDDLYGWSQPTEPGTFTINDDGSGEFVADADPERVASLVPWEQGPEGPLCE